MAVSQTIPHLSLSQAPDFQVCPWVICRDVCTDLVARLEEENGRLSESEALLTKAHEDGLQDLKESAAAYSSAVEKAREIGSQKLKAKEQIAAAERRLARVEKEIGARRSEIEKIEKEQDDIRRMKSHAIWASVPFISLVYRPIAAYKEGRPELLVPFWAEGEMLRNSAFGVEKALEEKADQVTRKKTRLEWERRRCLKQQSSSEEKVNSLQKELSEVRLQRRQEDNKVSEISQQLARVRELRSSCGSLLVQLQGMARHIQGIEMASDAEVIGQREVRRELSALICEKGPLLEFIGKYNTYFAMLGSVLTESK